MVNDHIAGNQNQQCNTNADQTGAKADNKCLRIEHLCDIVLGRTDGTQHTDLLGALHDGNIGDNADHNRRNHQRYRHKGDQRIADTVDDRADRGHHDTCHVGVTDHLIFLLLFFHQIIVSVQKIDKFFLRRKIQQVD